MPEKLLIGILGRHGSGRSFTWQNLFGRNVRTGKHERKLQLNAKEYVNVFLINGSPGERKKQMGELVRSGKPKIVLCSIDYKKSAAKTIDWFVKNNYFLFVFWLNPGYSSSQLYIDNLSIANRIITENSLLGKRNGKQHPKERVGEIRDFIHAWAKRKDILLTKKRKKPLHK